MSNLPSMRRGQPQLRSRQQGAIAIVVGLALAVLVGFVGLALDLGKLYVTKSELQNSADSCALAAARDLTGATPLVVSEAAGMTAGSLNKVLFQSGPVTMTTDQTVTYSDAVNDAFYDKDSAPYALNTIKYVKCSVSRGNIANWFIEMLSMLPGVSIGPSTVNAYAMATTTSAQTACAIPIFICKAAATSPYAIGQWLSSKFDASTPSAYGSGSFGWASLNGNNNAQAIKTQLGGAGQCNLNNVTQVGTQGNINSAPDYWNSRFGILPPSGQSLGVTDFTGYGYNDTTWPQGANAYPDFVAKRKAFAAYQGDAAMGWTNPNGTKGTPSPAAAYKSGADRRLVLAPIVDCSGFASSNQVTVTGWACLLMIEPMQNNGNNNAVRVEYRGDSSQPGSPCATQGIPGSAGGVGPLVPVLVQ